MLLCQSLTDSLLSILLNLSSVERVCHSKSSVIVVVVGGGGGGVENNVTSTIIQISVPIAIEASTWIRSSGYYECFFSAVKHGFLQKR